LIPKVFLYFICSDKGIFIYYENYPDVELGEIAQLSTSLRSIFIYSLLLTFYWLALGIIYGPCPEILGPPTEPPLPPYPDTIPKPVFAFY